jgi:HlyD family secretion protein
MQRLKGVWKWGLAVVVIGALVFAGVRVLGGRSKSTATNLTQVVTVQRGNLTASIAPTGQVAATKQVELSFDVSRIPLTDLKVTASQEVKKGDVLAQIDPSSLQQAVQQAQADLLSAQDALDTAQNPYTDLDRQNAQLAVAQAEVALVQAQQTTAEKLVEQAQFDLETAKLDLTITQHSTAVGKTVRDLQYTVAWHQRKLSGLQADLQQGKVDQGTVDDEAEALARATAQLQTAQANADSTLSASQDKVAQAEQALAALQANSNSLAQAQANNTVAQAQYNLAKAKDNLATTLAGPDPKALQLAQAKYDAAKATLDDAQATLDAATMVAPFDGTVLSVGAAIGDLVSSNVTVVTLADLNTLEVLTSIDETDISNVKTGQDAQITFDAFPGKRFQGKVLEVPLQGQLSQNVVTYEVPVSLEGTDGVALLPGMTANVKIILGQRQNALLLPVLAVAQGDNGNEVLLESGTGTVTTPVEVGLNDGVNVEIVRGLNEGDKVVVQYASTTQQGGFPGGFFIEAGPGGPQQQGSSSRSSSSGSSSSQGR